MPRRWSRLAFAALVFAAASAVSLVGYRIALTLPQSPLLTSLGYLGIFLLTLSFSATIFLPAPAFGAIAVAGTVLNPWLVAIAAGAGAATGETTAYFAGRSGRAVFEPESLRLFRRVHDWMRRAGFLTLFVLSAMPNPAFDVAGLTAGVLGYPLVRFWVAVALGKTVIYAVIAVAGSALLPAVIGPPTDEPADQTLTPPLLAAPYSAPLILAPGSTIRTHFIAGPSYSLPAGRDLTQSQETQCGGSTWTSNASRWKSRRREPGKAIPCPSGTGGGGRSASGLSRPGWTAFSCRLAIAPMRAT